jgi:RNA polymerase sigma factor (sigma-70 family)
VTPILSSTLLRTQSDGRLAMLAAQGHERAFEAIVERYRRPLHRYCRRILPEARAEDAVQQAFLKAWTALASGTDVQDLKPWLYRIAHNAALDSAKKGGYDYDELSDSLRLAPGAHEDLERQAVIRETLAGVAALPDNQREALLRTVVEGHSRAAIAADLNLTEGAVRQLVHRARLTLRAAATAVTPLPLASWAAAFNGAQDAPSVTQRIAELAGTAGSAGGAGVLLKAGAAVVATGALAVGPPGTALRQAVTSDDSKAKAADTVVRNADGGAGDHSSGGSEDGHGSGRGSGRHGESTGSRHAAGLDDHGGRRSGDGSRGGSGPGPSGLGAPILDDHHGSGSSGSSGSSGPGPGTSDGHSGSGSSGSGDGGGSGSSGPGSGTSGSDDGGVSGSSGPGSGIITTTTSSGSDGSGSGTSGSGSGTSSSGRDGSGDGGHDGTTTTVELPH